jgi:hypothetical protein
MATTTPMPAFAPEDSPPLSTEELLLCEAGLDDLLEPWPPVVTGLTESPGVAGAGTDGVPSEPGVDGVVPGDEGLEGVGIEGSADVGEGLVGEGSTGIPEGGGARGGGSV